MKGQRSLLSATLMAASSSFSQLPCVFLLFSLPLAVNAQPSQPTITGPPHRVNAGAKGKFECNSRGFPSENITVKWTKNRQPVQALKPNILKKSSYPFYEIHSTASVQLTEQDIDSKLTCKIQHPSLSKPLEQSFDLNNVLRVAPEVTLTTSHASPVPLNQSVKLTCKADNFYPSDISVSWWRSNYSNYTAKYNNSRGYGNGTYHLSVQLSTWKTGKTEITYMCQVIHDNEKIYYVSKTLKFGMLLEGSARSLTSGYFQLFCLWAGLFLGKVVAAVFILYLFWKISKINTVTLMEKGSSK